MSIDEIRTQKALALLEFTEAGERTAQARKKKEEFVKRVRAFALAIEENKAATLESEFSGITVSAAQEVLAECEEAGSRYRAANAKKAQFGL